MIKRRLFLECAVPSITASLYQRTAAWALDAFLFQVAFALMLPLPPSINELINHPQNTQHYVGQIAVVGLFVFVLYTAYHIVLEKHFSTTLGKFAVGIEVLYPSLTWSAVIGRFGACVLSWATLNLGHVMGYPNKPTLHDRLTATQVVASSDSFGGTPALSSFTHRVFEIVGLGWVVLLSGIIMWEMGKVLIECWLLMRSTL